MRKLLAAVAVVCITQLAYATSTINPNAPAPGAALNSAPIRQNFQAAWTDITNLLRMFSGTTAPSSPETFQLWADTTAAASPIKIWDGTQWVATGTLNRTTHVYSLPGLSAFPSIAANTILGNGTNASAVPQALAIPSCSTATSALQWVTSTGWQCNTALISLSGTNVWTGLNTFRAVPVRITANAQTPPSSPYGEMLRLTADNDVDTNLIIESYGFNGVHASNGHLIFRNANGTASVPTATGAVPCTLGPIGDASLNLFDYLGTFAGTGYMTTGFRVLGAAAMSFCPTQLWTDTANGAQIRFLITPNGSTQNRYPFVMDQDSSFSINAHLTLAPLAPINSQTLLKVVNADDLGAAIATDAIGPTATTFASHTTRRARGTRAAPAAVQTGDFLGVFGAYGYAGAAFGTGSPFLAFNSSQTWTGTNQGSYAEIYTTPNNASLSLGRVRFEQSGGVTVPSTVTGGDPGSGGVNATVLQQAGVGVVTTARSISTTSPLSGGGDLSANRTLSIAALGIDSTLIAANAVTLAKLATQATNTVLGNATSGTAVPTALAVGTCSTSSSALIWTTNTGFGCNTSINAATLGSATFAAPGAIGGGTASAGTFTTLTGAGTLSHTGGYALLGAYNTSGSTYPPVGGNPSPMAIGWNFTNGGGDISLFNTYTPATTASFVFRQLTGASAQTTLLTVGTSGIVIAPTTDATSVSTGAIQNPGGMSVNKRVFMNGLTTSAAVQTAVICQSSGGELIADSVACLASAARFKDLHGRLEDGALAKLTKLPIERWSYKPEGIFVSDGWSRERIGPLADDVAEMDDRLVGYDSDGQIKTYSTEQLLGFTIKAIQELAAEVTSLRADNAGLRRAVPLLRQTDQ